MVGAPEHGYYVFRRWATYNTLRIETGILCYADSKGRLMPIVEGTVKADEVRFQKNAAAERRAFERTLGVNPWSRYFKNRGY